MYFNNQIMQAGMRKTGGLMAGNSYLLLILKIWEVICHKSLVISRKSLVISHKSLVISYKSLVISYKSLVISHKSLVFSDKSLVFSNYSLMNGFYFPFSSTKSNLKIYLNK
jgi:hypothetical protein